MTVYKKVDIGTPPQKEGKYIVITQTTFLKNTHKFEAYFNGKSFNVSGQVVTHWLLEKEIDVPLFSISQQY